MNKVPETIRDALSKIFPIKFKSIIDSLVFLGFFFSTSESTGSTPRLCAGGPSIIIFIQRICIAFKGDGKWNTVEKAIKDKAEILVLS